MNSETMEDLAMSWAAYAGHRWEDLNEGGREHYRRLVRHDIERRKAEPPLAEPRLPPFFDKF